MFQNESSIHLNRFKNAQQFIQDNNLADSQKKGEFDSPLGLKDRYS